MLSERDLAEFKRGSLQMVALFLLREGDKYGYQIAQDIKRRSKGKFPIAQSVLYVVLYRMAEKGYISKKEEEGCKKPKTFYHLEPTGEDFLNGLLKAYAEMSEGVSNIIDSGERSSSQHGT